MRAGDRWVCAAFLGIFLALSFFSFQRRFSAHPPSPNASRYFSTGWFDRRGTHKFPDHLPELPQSLNREYRRLAGELDLSGISFIQAQQFVKSFLEPVFSNQPLGEWRYQKGEWDTR
jgi:hypothetical protein